MRAAVKIIRSLDHLGSRALFHLNFTLSYPLFHRLLIAPTKKLQSQLHLPRETLAPQLHWVPERWTSLSRQRLPLIIHRLLHQTKTIQYPHNHLCCNTNQTDTSVAKHKCMRTLYSGRQSLEHDDKDNAGADATEEYAAEAIVAHFQEHEKNYYLVKWEGYEDSHEWLPKKILRALQTWSLNTRSGLDGGTRKSK